MSRALPSEVSDYKWLKKALNKLNNPDIKWTTEVINKLKNLNDEDKGDNFAHKCNWIAHDILKKNFKQNMPKGEVIFNFCLTEEFYITQDALWGLSEYGGKVTDWSKALKLANKVSESKENSYDFREILKRMKWVELSDELLFNLIEEVFNNDKLRILSRVLNDYDYDSRTSETTYKGFSELIKNLKDKESAVNSLKNLIIKNKELPEHYTKLCDYLSKIADKLKEPDKIYDILIKSINERRENNFALVAASLNIIKDLNINLDKLFIKALEKPDKINNFYETCRALGYLSNEIKELDKVEELIWSVINEGSSKDFLQCCYGLSLINRQVKDMSKAVMEIKNLKNAGAPFIKFCTNIEKMKGVELNKLLDNNEVIRIFIILLEDYIKVENKKSEKLSSEEYNTLIKEAINLLKSGKHEGLYKIEGLAASGITSQPPGYTPINMILKLFNPKRGLWESILNVPKLTEVDKKLIKELKNGGFSQPVKEGEFTYADLLVEAYRAGAGWAKKLRQTDEAKKALNEMKKIGIKTEKWDNPKFKRLYKLTGEFVEVTTLTHEDLKNLINEIKDEQLYNENLLIQQIELTDKDIEVAKSLSDIKNLIGNIKKSKNYRNAKNDEVRRKIIDNNISKVTDNLSKKDIKIKYPDYELLINDIELEIKNDEVIIKGAKLKSLKIKGAEVRNALFTESTTLTKHGLTINIKGLMHDYEKKEPAHLINQLRDHWVSDEGIKEKINEIIRTKVATVKGAKGNIMIKTWRRNVKLDFKDSDFLHACVFLGGQWQLSFPLYFWDVRISFLDTYVNNKHELRTFLLAGRTGRMGRTPALIVHGTEGRANAVNVETTRAVMKALNDYAKECGYEQILLSTYGGNTAKEKFRDQVLMMKLGELGEYDAEQVSELNIKNAKNLRTAFEAWGLGNQGSWKELKGKAEFIKIEV